MINSFTLEGNLTKDAVVRQVGDTSVTEFTVANNRYAGKDKDSDTLFRRCKGWGGRYAAIAPYLTKGKHVVIVGVEKDEKWTKDGVEHVMASITLVDISIISDSRRNEGSQNEKVRNESYTENQQSASRAESDFVDDIPF